MPPVTVTAPLNLLGNADATAWPLAPLGLTDSSSLKLSANASVLASRIDSIMPEAYDGENFDRAEKLARGPSNEATQEHINIAIFELSNKLDTKLSWQQKLEILETSGIMSSRVQLNQHIRNLGTISALAEIRFQDAFEFLYNSRTHEASENLQSRSVKLIIWFLSLGFCSDTYIHLSTPQLHSGQALVSK